MRKKRGEDETIKVLIKRNDLDEICAFEVKNHGPSIVCAAVSILVINTVNCIDKFTAEKMECHVDEKQGLIACSFPNIESNLLNRDVKLLLDTMLFGLNNISFEYKNTILISDREASNC